MNIKLETIAGTEENSESEKEEKLDGFMAGLNEFINALAKPFKDGLCYMPVSEFDQLAEDCGYLKFEIQGLRKQLKQKGYIRTVGDRYAIMIRFAGKPIRAIAFVEDEITKHKNIKLNEKTMTKKQEDK